MKRTILLSLAVVSSVLSVHALEPAFTNALARGFLPDLADQSSWSSVYSQIEAADAKADQAWKDLASRADYDAYRKALREKMIAAIGGFPEKTPLNARVVETLPRDGYRIEKVIFESMPGLFVTANLFVPTATSFAAPHPVAVLSCGHSWKGKDCDTYLRACVLLAKRGIAAFMFDPHDQGERLLSKDFGSCPAHNLTGFKAMLLGWSMPMLRIWDGVRAIDYVQSRPDLDPNRVGYMGQSGGGTMTSLMMAVDERIKVAAPSCYLTNFRSLMRLDGPQDAEQNIFGQLAFGLNHTGYALMPDAKVLVTGRLNDFFPYCGLRELFRVVEQVSTRLGTRGHYDLNLAPGPHGWTEATMTASADWMAAWLLGRVDLLPLEFASYRALNLGWSESKVELGLSEKECGVTPDRCVFKLPGATDIHAVLRARLDTLEKARKPMTAGERTALVKRLAVIREPGVVGLVTKELGATDLATATATRLAFMYADGLALPAVLLTPKKADPSAEPVLLVAPHGRLTLAEEAARELAAGHTVLVADTFASGEIGGAAKLLGEEPRHFYGATDCPEENVAAMLYLLGESLVGRRASDILELAAYLNVRTGRAPRLVAKGSLAIAAAHACAVKPALFAGVKTIEPPLSWSAFVRAPGIPPTYHYAYCVNGALAYYDWTDLLP